MIKKIIITFLVFIFSINSIFAYKITKKDELILNKFYMVIDKIYKKDSNRVRNFYFSIKKIRKKYKNKKNKIRFYTLITKLEKYLDKKLNNFNKNSYHFGGSNLTPPEKIKKVKLEEQDSEAIEFAKKEKINKNKRTKKITSPQPSPTGEGVKKNIKKILKTTRKNGVLVKYVKLEKNKYIPKNTPKNLVPKIQKYFLVKKILSNKQNKNIILVNYYGKIKIFSITGLEDYSCNQEKLNNYLKNNIENKKVRLENIKKISRNNLKAEFIVNSQILSKNIIDEGFCKLKK